MARIRTIKPEFWRNQQLSEISPEAALLAIGLLNHADDEGYFKYLPKLIESDVFPLRELSVSIHSLLTELSVIGYIQVYECSLKNKYGHIVNFSKHQIVNRKNDSKIKELELSPVSSVTNQLQITENSVSSHLNCVQERKGKEGKGVESTRATEPKTAYDFETYTPPPQDRDWTLEEKRIHIQHVTIDMAIQLRKLGIDTTCSHPSLLDFAKRGYEADLMVAAAKIALERGKLPSEIHPGYLRPIANQLIEDSRNE